MRLTLVEPPEGFISLEEAREQCRVDGDDEDALLQRAIDATTSYLDGYRGILGRCIVDQVWRIDVGSTGRTFRLPFPDIRDVTAVFTDDAGGVVPMEMCCDRPAINFGMVWGRPMAITFTAGFGPVHAVPAAIRQAGLMLVDFYYNQRGGLGDGPGIPPEVEAMISPFRVWRI